MHVTLVLDSPHVHYTNLDVISGKAVLRVTASGTVSSIIVKLEGESSTRLEQPSVGNENYRTPLEVHKVQPYGTLRASVFPWFDEKWKIN